MKPAETFWTRKQVLVTGGASFIGSTLTDQLLARGAKVRVVDDLTSGHLENLKEPMAKGTVEFVKADRVADNALAKKLLGWEPKVPFKDGLKRTIDWYYATKNKEEVKRIFARMLTET